MRDRGANHAESLTHRRATKPHHRRNEALARQPDGNPMGFGRRVQKVALSVEGGLAGVVQGDRNAILPSTEQVRKGTHQHEEMVPYCGDPCERMHRAGRGNNTDTAKRSDDVDVGLMHDHTRTRLLIKQS